MSFSAARGYAPALHDLAKLYLYGRGADKDQALGMRFLERTTEAGSIMAKRRLAGLMLSKHANLRGKLLGLRMMAG